MSFFLRYFALGNNKQVLIWQASLLNKFTPTMETKR